MFDSWALQPYRHKYKMEEDNYWKRLAVNMLLSIQALFLASTAADFFLTIAGESERAYLLLYASPYIASFITVPWAILILFLAILLINGIRMREEIPFTTRVTVEYILFFLGYMTLLVLALINPVIPVSVVIYYLVNLLLLCFILATRVIIQSSFNKR